MIVANSNDQCIERGAEAKFTALLHINTTICNCLTPLSLPSPNNTGGETTDKYTVAYSTCAQLTFSLFREFLNDIIICERLSDIQSVLIISP